MIPPAPQGRATIHAVKIRAVTLGLDLPYPNVATTAFERAAAFLSEARTAFGAVGLEVQTIRVAGPDLAPALATLGGPGLTGWTAEAERVARDVGVEYLSFGRLPASAHEFVATRMAPTLAAGEIGFFSADLVDAGLPSVAMAAACARAVRQLARSTALGFGNLRFAATA